MVKEKLSEKILLWVLAILLLGAALNQFRQSISWSNNSWQITEWLINYAGGFVRRGLPGEILWYSSNLLDLNANHIAIAFSFLLYIGLFAFFILKTRGIFSPLLILSPIIMGAPAYQNFIVRKDVLIVVLFLIGIKMAININGKFIKSLALGILCATAILVHESFFFVALPSIFIALFGNLKKNSSNKNGNLFSLASVMIISVVSFAFVVAFKGNPNTAFEINQSWLPLWKKISCQDCLFDKPSAAIDAIGWTTKQGLSLSLSLLKSFSWGIWVPLAWLLTIGFCYWAIVTSLVRNEYSEMKKIAAILLFQLGCISPLFVLGWDFGRWIFMWTTSSLILFIFHNKTDAFLALPTNLIADKSLEYSIFTVRPSFWILLFFGIPGCCWSVAQFISSAPIGYYFMYLLKWLKA